MHNHPSGVLRRAIHQDEQLSEIGSESVAVTNAWGKNGPTLLQSF